MSAPVDVLAVMDGCVAGTREALPNIRKKSRDECEQFISEMAEARAAVAELIAALKHARSTLGTALRHAAPDLFETDEDVTEHLAIKRIDAALARAQGGAA